MDFFKQSIKLVSSELDYYRKLLLQRQFLVPRFESLCKSSQTAPALCPDALVMQQERLGLIQLVFAARADGLRRFARPAPEHRSRWDRASA